MKPLLSAKRCVRAREGGSLVEVAVILPLLALLLAGIVDFGRAFYYSNSLARAAETGAIYGTQNPGDTAGMVQAAETYAQNLNGVTAQAIYGCECSDGTAKSPGCATTPSCSTNEVYYVTVTSKDNYKPLVAWPGLPSSYTLSSSVTMNSGG